MKKFTNFMLCVAIAMLGVVGGANAQNNKQRLQQGETVKVKKEKVATATPNVLFEDASMNSKLAAAKAKAKAKTAAKVTNTATPKGTKAVYNLTITKIAGEGIVGVSSTATAGNQVYLTVQASYGYEVRGIYAYGGENMCEEYTVSYKYGTGYYIAEMPSTDIDIYVAFGVATPKNLNLHSETAFLKAEWKAGENETEWEVVVSNVLPVVKNTTVTKVSEPEFKIEIEGNQTYYVLVRAIGADGVRSEWVMASYTSADCGNNPILTFILKDSYGDGWNGAYIRHELSSGETEKLTVEGSSNRVVVKQSGGRYYWVSGSYDEEASFVVTDEKGNEVFKCNDAEDELSDGQLLFTIDVTLCEDVYCPAPTDFAYTLNGNLATFTWNVNGDVSAWDFVLAERELTLEERKAAAEHITTAAMIKNLKAGVKYHAYVRSNCDVMEGVWQHLTCTSGTATYNVESLYKRIDLDYYTEDNLDNEGLFTTWDGNDTKVKGYKFSLTQRTDVSFNLRAEDGGDFELVISDNPALSDPTTLTGSNLEYASDGRVALLAGTYYVLVNDKSDEEHDYKLSIRKFATEPTLTFTTLTFPYEVRSEEATPANTVAENIGGTGYGFSKFYVLDLSNRTAETEVSFIHRGTDAKLYVATDEKFTTDVQSFSVPNNGKVTLAAKKYYLMLKFTRYGVCTFTMCDNKNDGIKKISLDYVENGEWNMNTPVYYWANRQYEFRGGRYSFELTDSTHVEIGLMSEKLGTSWHFEMFKGDDLQQSGATVWGGGSFANNVLAPGKYYLVWQIDGTFSREVYGKYKFFVRKYNESKDTEVKNITLDYNETLQVSETNHKYYRLDLAAETNVKVELDANLEDGWYVYVYDMTKKSGDSYEPSYLPRIMTLKDSVALSVRNGLNRLGSKATFRLTKTTETTLNSYTNVDYSRTIKTNTDVKGKFSDKDVYVNDAYWYGRAQGFNVAMKSGKTYTLSLTLSGNTNANFDLEPYIGVLKDTTVALTGTYDDNRLAGAGESSIDGAYSFSQEISYTPTADGMYRILIQDYYYGNDYVLRVSESQSANSDYKTFDYENWLKVGETEKGTLHLKEAVYMQTSEDNGYGVGYSVELKAGKSYKFALETTLVDGSDDEYLLSQSVFGSTFTGSYYDDRLAYVYTYTDDKEGQSTARVVVCVTPTVDGTYKYIFQVVGIYDIDKTPIVEYTIQVEEMSKILTIYDLLTSAKSVKYSTLPYYENAFFNETSPIVITDNDRFDPNGEKDLVYYAKAYSIELKKGERVVADFGGYADTYMQLWRDSIGATGYELLETYDDNGDYDEVTDHSRERAEWVAGADGKYYIVITSYRGCRDFNWTYAMGNCVSDTYFKSEKTSVKPVHLEASAKKITISDSAAKEGAVRVALAALKLNIVDESGKVVRAIDNKAENWFIDMSGKEATYRVELDLAPAGYEMVEGDNVALVCFAIEGDGLEQVTISNKATLYPNPAADFCYVRLNGVEAEKAVVYDLTGRVVMEQVLTGAEVEQLNVSNLSKGIYQVRLGAQVEKLVKK